MSIASRLGLGPSPRPGPTVNRPKLKLKGHAQCQCESLFWDTIIINYLKQQSYNKILIIFKYLYNVPYFLLWWCFAVNSLDNILQCQCKKIQSNFLWRERSFEDYYYCIIKYDVIFLIFQLNCLTHLLEKTRCVCISMHVENTCDFGYISNIRYILWKISFSYVLQLWDYLYWNPWPSKHINTYISRYATINIKWDMADKHISLNGGFFDVTPDDVRSSGVMTWRFKLWRYVFY